jgi:VWFA-related protein
MNLLRSGVGVVACAASLAVAQAPAQFRSKASAIAVDVVVLQGNTPVAGLTAADFLLSDNGVARPIEVVAASELPLTVSLVLDASGSMRPLTGRLHEERGRFVDLLRPSDALEILTFGTRLHDADARTAPIVAAGMTALYDSLAAAIMRDRAIDRRRLIVVITDGADNVSFLDPSTLLNVAARGDATVEIVLLGTMSVQVPAGAVQRRTDSPTDLLRRLARSTGGDLLDHPSRRDLAETCRGLLDRFRRGYVLYFVPEGVPRPGWHELDVRVVRRGGGGLTVRARKGYFE